MSLAWEQDMAFAQARIAQLELENEALLRERDRLRENLDGRDDFLVRKGLWSEFMDQLPR